jgi:quercetin dioxygenase-like cupin family protein
MSKIHRFTGSAPQEDFAWEGVSPVEINTPDVHGIIKHVLVGPDDGAPTFVIRYFQVPINESTFDHQHPHEHGMVILHGKARLMINQEFHELGPLDSVFVSGNDRHQLVNIGDSTLGFLCVIPKIEE